MDNEQNNELGNDILSAGDKEARYDQHAKRLLSNKRILAWILRETSEEFREYTVAEIKDMIEGEPEVGVVPTNPGLTNAKITGQSTESNIPNEGVVTFDICFYVRVPVDGIRQKIIVNVEAQNQYDPGYPLVKRGFYYDARLLSAQYGTEFSDSHYEEIKKVSSIWICPKVPVDIRNTITKYSIQPENIVGQYPIEQDKKAYDVMNVIIVRIGDFQGEKKLLGMLSVLFSEKMPPSEKKGILETVFDIPTTTDEGKEMDSMCNLGHGIFLDGVQEGMQRGTYMNQISSILTMLEDDLTEEQICKYQHVDPDFFRQVYQLHETDPEMTPEEIYEQLQEDVVGV